MGFRRKRGTHRKVGKGMTKKTRLKKKMDKMVQRICVSNNPICFVCGKPTKECHHYIPKSQSLNLRYDFRNLIPLCKSCHFRHHKGDPQVHKVILEKKGFEWHEALQRDRRKIFKNTLGNLKEVKERLEEK